MYSKLTVDYIMESQIIAFLSRASLALSKRPPSEDLKRSFKLVSFVLSDVKDLDEIDDVQRSHLTYRLHELAHLARVSEYNSIEFPVTYQPEVDLEQFGRETKLFCELLKMGKRYQGIKIRLPENIDEKNLERLEAALKSRHVLSSRPLVHINRIPPILIPAFTEIERIELSCFSSAELSQSLSSLAAFQSLPEHQVTIQLQNLEFDGELLAPHIEDFYIKCGISVCLICQKDPANFCQKLMLNTQDYSYDQQQFLSLEEPGGGLNKIKITMDKKRSHKLLPVLRRLLQLSTLQEVRFHGLYVHNENMIDLLSEILSMTDKFHSLTIPRLNDNVGWLLRLIWA